MSKQAQDDRNERFLGDEDEVEFVDTEESENMDKNRVYVSEPSEAPNDALVREGGRGRYYYVTGERGQNHDVGGDKDNPLIEITIEDLDKQVELTEGDVFYDTINETEAMISEINGDEVTVTTNSAEWAETVEDVRSKLEDQDWVHLPDEERSTKQDDNPCWEGYEMVGTKVQDGEEVPNCVPKSDVQQTVGEMDNPTRREVLRQFNAQTDEKQDDDPCWEGYEMVGMKVQDGEKVPNCVPEDEVENAEKLYARDEKQGELIGKPFEGPEGQGPWDGFSECVESMGDEDGITNAEGWCAWAHHEDTGDWPSEKQSKGTRVYVGSKDSAPDKASVRKDEKGHYYIKEEVYEEARVLYPDVTEEEHQEETGVEMTDPEMAGDGVSSEEEHEEEREERRESMEDLEDSTGLGVHST